MDQQSQAQAALKEQRAKVTRRTVVPKKRKTVLNDMKAAELKEICQSNGLQLIKGHKAEMIQLLLDNPQIPLDKKPLPSGGTFLLLATFQPTKIA